MQYILTDLSSNKYSIIAEEADTHEEILRKANKWVFDCQNECYTMYIHEANMIGIYERIDFDPAVPELIEREGPDSLPTKANFDGECYKLLLVFSLKVIDRRENYELDHIEDEDLPEDVDANDLDMWPYSNDFDTVCEHTWVTPEVIQ